MRYKPTVLRDLNRDVPTQLSAPDLLRLSSWMGRLEVTSYMHPDTLLLLKATLPKRGGNGTVFLRDWMPENTIIIYDDDEPWVYTLPYIPLTEVF